jgi:hypothetical protein
MNNTVERIKKDIAYFRKEAAYNLRQSRSWRSHDPLKNYYSGRYQSLKHASEYIAITLGVAEREETSDVLSNQV